MESLASIALPFKDGSNGTVELNRIQISDGRDCSRYSLVLEERDQIKRCVDIKKIRSSNKEEISNPLNFIQNLDYKDGCPLLLKVPSTFTKLKLSLLVKQMDENKDNSLIILKTMADDRDVPELLSLISKNEIESSRRLISKVSYSKILSKNYDNAYQDITINDNLKTNAFRDNRLNVVVFEFNPSNNSYSHCFNFSFWVDDAVPFDLVNSRDSNTHSFEEEQTPIEVNLSKYPTLRDYKEAFGFNIEDGPEFRKRLVMYEEGIPNFKALCDSIKNEVRALEILSNSLDAKKSRLIDSVKQLVRLQLTPILSRLGFEKDFEKAINAFIEPMKKNLRHFISEVSDPKLLAKICSTLSNVGASGDSSTHNELSRRKKTFETMSKEYYSWLNKYLSNERERPQSKLLAKRKNFEISKVDYLSYLNSLINNQYFNQLLENLFKFICTERKAGFTFIDLSKYFASSRNALEGHYEVYLIALSRFNSEKLQLRQLIEACQTNEELSDTVKLNSLKFEETQELGNVENLTITKENLDMIFASESDLTTINAVPVNMEDQKSEMVGILYALGGQGKPGWHKEWVVLSEGRLMEYSDWRNGKSPVNKPIDIALSSIKPLNYEKRHNCFEIFSADGHKHVFQAFSEEERTKWLKALYNAGQVFDTNKLNIPLKSNKKDKDKEKRKPLGALITDLTSPDKSFTLATSVDSAFSPISILPGFISEEQDYLKLVRSKKDAENHKCADCGSSESVEWISINLFVAICVNCSSCHRHLGSHISKVKSLKLDKFEAEKELLLNYINNKYVNSYMEANLSESEKIGPDAPDNARLAFIRAKYSLKSYTLHIDGLNDRLVRACQKIDIPEVIKFISCGADINIRIHVHINSNKEYSSVSLLEYSLRKYVENKPSGSSETKKFFVITELLVLSGYNLEALPTPPNTGIGLTDEANEYWNSRRSKQSGETPYSS
ncbi:Piso0_005675 [Millerozyma farinosa CBS 7064]|uniref:ADP-ribosylation factor GTPase-activating protein n=1 Tax=Pichia sorbitophila (strain ATCC MYA-4447 / BCRC 22081 / CBS 7064 / NBRC 10061 / NRRL Y-12695) TaxID=559304 RepID=G8Y2M0_PICSO|nr:Piso0_005675 [Millerozyma farinosa CBS 7064]